jgi:hypothetical protein
MHASDAQFEVFRTARDLSGSWSGGTALGRRIVRPAEIRRPAGNYKNSGNELNKCFKMNYITFFDVANYALFARKRAQIERSKGQTERILGKTCLRFSSRKAEP